MNKDIVSVTEDLKETVEDFSAIVRREEELINEGMVEDMFELIGDKERVVDKLLKEASELRSIVSPQETLGEFLTLNSNHESIRDVDEIRAKVMAVMSLNQKNFLKVKARAEVDAEFLQAAGIIESEQSYGPSAVEF